MARTDRYEIDRRGPSRGSPRGHGVGALVAFVLLLAGGADRLDASRSDQGSPARRRVVGSVPTPFLGACPYGHEHLVEVPPDSREISLPATVRRFKIVCQTCGFRSVDPAAEDHWFRDAADAASFEVPLHPLIHDFPVLPWHDDAGSELRPSYRQEVRDGVLADEHLAYSTTEPYETIIDHLVGHLASFGADFEIDGGAQAFRLQVLEPGVDATVSVTCPQPPRCQVIVRRRPLPPGAEALAGQVRGTGGAPQTPGQAAAVPTLQPRATDRRSAMPVPDPNEQVVFEEPIKADELPRGTDFRAAEKRSSPLPGYTEIARKQRIQGVVIANLHIDRHGRVRSVEITQSCGPELDASATEAFLRWRFAPARLDGHPVASIQSVTVNFRLQ